jgi:hypothetical protein
MIEREAESIPLTPLSIYIYLELFKTVWYFLFFILLYVQIFNSDHDCMIGLFTIVLLLNSIITYHYYSWYLLAAAS